MLNNNNHKNSDNTKYLQFLTTRCSRRRWSWRWRRQQYIMYMYISVRLTLLKLLTNARYSSHAALDGVGRGGGGGARKGGKGPDTIVKRPTPGKPKP
jgi:hypothetical protein